MIGIGISLMSILFLGIIKVIEYRNVRKEQEGMYDLEIKKIEPEYEKEKLECLELIYNMDLAGDYDNIDKDKLFIFYPGGVIKWDEYEEYKKKNKINYGNNNN